MDLNTLLAAYKQRSPQGVPPVLMGQQAAAPPPVMTPGAPPMGVSAPVLEQPIAGMPNSQADIVVPNAGYPDPLTPQEHKGMFGIKGTWRDVLGGIGDTLLIGSGGKAVYGPQREKEKIGDITANFDLDPELTIRRLNQEGFPDVAAEYQKRYAEAQVAQTKADQWQSEQDLRTNRDTRETNEYNDKGLINVISLLQTGDEKNWPQVSARAKQYAESRNIPLPFEIPTAYTPNWFDQVGYFGTEPFDIEKQDDTNDYRDASLGMQGRRISVQENLGQQRIGISSQQAKTSAQSAGERRRANRKREDQNAEKIAWSKDPANPRNQPRSGRRQRGGPPAVKPAVRK